MLGGLYTWPEAMRNAPPDNGGESGVGSTQGICPEGWHLPTKSELDDYLFATAFTPEENKTRSALVQQPGAAYTDFCRNHNSYVKLDFLHQNVQGFDFDEYSFITSDGLDGNIALPVRCVKQTGETPIAVRLTHKHMIAKILQGKIRTTKDSTYSQFNPHITFFLRH